MSNIKIRPSSIGMFMRCPKQWYYRYVENIKTKPNAAMTVGTSVHAGIEANYEQKIKSKKNLKTAQVVEVFADTFAKDKRKIDWKAEDITPDKAQAVGIKALTHYHEVRAPLIQPLLVEKQVTIKLDLGDGMVEEMEGTLDLIDDKRTLRDHKTSKDKPKEVKVDHCIQTAIYKMGAEQEGYKVNKVEIDYIVKSAVNPTVISITVPDTKPLALQVIKGMRTNINAGNFMPNPDGWWCSAKWCGYHHKNGGPCRFGM